MGWATTLISPPDGDLGAFRASLARLQARGEAVYYPGHGAPVARPAARSSRICSRTGRRARRRSSRRWRAGRRRSAELVAAIYAGVDPALHAAAARNVLAHLIDLEERGLAAADGPLRPDGGLAAAV